MFFTDDALEVAQRVVVWVPDPAVLEEQQALAVHRRVELSKHGVPLDPPCDICPARSVCNMECSAFRQYLNAPLSQCKQL